MKKEYTLKKIIAWLLRELAMQVVVQMTHRERDIQLRELINHTIEKIERLDGMSEDDIDDMDAIPF